MENKSKVKSENDKMISQYKKVVYHYTTLEAAIKILSTNTLRFGRFKSMNDIAESKRKYLSNISSELIDKEFHNYQSLSLTIDSRNSKGFEIDSLWGYYADKGNGVCLAFNKEKLISAFKNQTSFHRYSPITYLPNFTSNVPLQVEKEENLHKDIIKNIKNIFFTKSKDWKHENEYRFLTYSHQRFTLDYSDSLLAIILCLPQIEEIKDSLEYKILSRISDTQILRYQAALGNKELVDIKGNIVYPIMEKDYLLDI